MPGSWYDRPLDFSIRPVKELSTGTFGLLLHAHLAMDRWAKWPIQWFIQGNFEGIEITVC